MSEGNENRVASATQDQWVEICAAVRAQLAKQVELMPAMEPGEVSSFVGAIDAAMWVEVKAESYDEAVEERRKSLERGSLYGS